jgi:hypothetical protein
MNDPCTARIKNDHSEEACVLEAGHRDSEYGTDHAGPRHPMMGRLRWNDSAVGAVPHQPSDPAATEATELDKSRRYLRPVADYGSDETHWSVYEWLPQFEAWATGMSLCGGSMRQGPLPSGTAVSCVRCQEWRPRYERMLAPGYRPEDDDPDVLRARLERIRAEVGLLCDCCGDNRERMGRIRRELGLDTEGYFREDGEDR